MDGQTNNVIPIYRIFFKRATQKLEGPFDDDNLAMAGYKLYLSKNKNGVM